MDLHGITKFAYGLHVVFTFLLAAHGFLWCAQTPPFSRSFEPSSLMQTSAFL